jgi:negative regulator of flagellin synthesis FlgM
VKIGNPSELFRSGSPAGGAAPTDADKAKVSVSALKPVDADTSARVKLSGGLDTLKADLNADAAFDTKRVEELKAAIADGSFKVDASIVADKVISSNLEALTRSTSE